MYDVYIGNRVGNKNKNKILAYSLCFSINTYVYICTCNII